MNGPSCNPTEHPSSSLPARHTRGLYDPAYEKAACGVGLICNMHGEKSHQIVSDALQILVNLTHRGAAGADARTGDGAGILMQVPHQFLQDHFAEHEVRLPDEGSYGVGMFFMPQDEKQRRILMDDFERIVAAEGQRFLGWRRVPTHPEFIGAIARSVEPAVYQAAIAPGSGITDMDAFERKLYVIRRVMENYVRGSDLPEKKFFHISSLSYRTLVYKGLLLADQIERYYPDLADESMRSALALVHQRYSTNTFATWDLAQPFRFLCHNGEINTLRGNINWMNARQGLFKSPLFGKDMSKLFPVLTPGASDSAVLDNAVELLYHTGRSLPHAIMMLIPEAWEKHRTMPAEKKAFYEYHACLMEPWDGPASIPFTDGHCIGAVLDRNGLRPSRYTVTKDGFVVMASETGVLDIDPANVLHKGRLEPGRMFLVDIDQGRIVDDEEIKNDICRRKPYRRWLKENMIPISSLGPGKDLPENFPSEEVEVHQRLHGYSLEDERLFILPMAKEGKDPTGSMGADYPLAVLSEKPQLLYNYFKQLFAQVTNPPLDAIREELVTSLITHLGAEQDLFEETAAHCRRIRLEHTLLTNEDLARIRNCDRDGLKNITLPAVFPADGGGSALEKALDDLCRQASDSIKKGFTILIISDRMAGRENAPIPALLAVAAVHHHLIRERLRTRCALVIESGEPREVHHFCLLLGYGAAAINPYLAFETIRKLRREGFLPDIDDQTACQHYIKAVNKGILKAMSKMGISTVLSYRGAQIFEAVGISTPVIEKYFPGTSSRIEGIGLEEIARETALRHQEAFPRREIPARLNLNVGGRFKWRRLGEYHLFNPLTIAKLQQATRENNPELYREYTELVHGAQRQLCTLRGLLEITPGDRTVPIEEVEPWTQIVKRFKTGAMSYGSISREAHETLAVAMNRIGGKSNSGEGGEDPARYRPFPNGAWRRSAIKQVASGRFGVTSNYLANAVELQIKMAQGAKPGEGGQLPGFKVYPWIAKTRHSTPYVTLISPPPHHDIYSIEDLAQLIHDLKNANPTTRINVKLVSEIGVGIVAAGVAKGKADVVLISGYDGGTGASPKTSIMHAGLPWELGLSETHQTLVLNDLRDRITVECDGKLMTGRDVAVACLLGAEEFGFSTAPLVVLGCVMMRVCHLNTCPVGIATQDPDLRRRFRGRPEYLVNYFRFVAEELREIMAKLGFRTIEEMVGRCERLSYLPAENHWKAGKLDYSRILYKPDPKPGSTLHCSRQQNHGLDKALDRQLIEKAQPALEQGRPVEFDIEIRNTNRTVGTMLSYEISRRFGEDGLPDDTITINCHGSAGQSFCAFGTRGLTVFVEGDANDYFGKGLSGAKLIIRPPAAATFVPEKNIIIGNVALYGATSGQAYIRGMAGERFCVRNSGALAVVEGIGDHGCEYMTGGRVVIIGPTGRNFAAGMTGGIAYVLDRRGDFAENRCNRESINLEKLSDPEEIETVRQLLENHHKYTGSSVAETILNDWERTIPLFVKVMPVDYRHALEKIARGEVVEDIDQESQGLIPIAG